MKRIVVVSCVLGLLAACSLSSEDGFIQGARKDPCDNAIPVCSYTAGCRLVENENYIEAAFPGFLSFIVPTAGEAEISVIFYFRDQAAPGSDTEIIWYEPGCRDQYSHYLPGIDLFRQVGNDRLWTVVGTVYQEGDHMIEIRSDASAEFLLKIEIEQLTN
ncbi:MAG: hypothetical protein ABIJ09_15315 [Pseudomonadota bacterium]